MQHFVARVCVAVLLSFLCVCVTVNSQASFCTFDSVLGCFVDGDPQVLNFTTTALGEEGTATHSRCATACKFIGYSLAGVENSYECFCGNEIHPNATPAPLSDCQVSKCLGDSSEFCGGPGRILVATIGQCTQQPPNFHACVDPVSKDMPFCDHTLDIETRVQDLMSRAELGEKINMISPQSVLGDTCETHTSGIPSVGLGPYGWLIETNTGVATACITPDRCATTFSGPMGMGASFNRTSWRLKGSVFGTEMRAFSNSHWHRGELHGNGSMIGLTGYGPNINIARDPRFGRSSELPGEDPVHSGTYAAEMVKGMQEPDSNGHPKMIALLKHFTAYSTEQGRGSDNYDISMFDLWDTYLAQYEIAFLQGNASGVMCSYNGINSHPSCANGYILNDVLRGMWSRDALVTTDCGAIQNLYNPPVRAPDNLAAVAYAINNGTDIEMGSTLMTYSLQEAIQRQLTTEDILNTAVRRSLLPLFRAGRFDPVDTIDWFKYNLTHIASPYHKQIQFEAALQSFVLLKNANSSLPLAVNTRVAVLGPQGVARDGLLSDYYGDQVCYDMTFDCIPTIAEQIALVNNINNTNNTLVAKGVDVNSNDASGIQPALDLISQVDVVVLVLGIDRSIEHEGIDRTDTALPGLQEQFAKQVLASGKPVILVLTNGGQLAIDDLINGPVAIVEAFNPSLAGAKALAETLFGKHNRWGKLPVTMYPHDYIQQQPMSNYDMSVAPGRTYRYYQGTPLFPFGTGLSYTTFNISCSSSLSSSSPTLVSTITGGPGVLMQITCTVTNTGSREGDEVVMLFHSAGQDIRKSVNHPVPIKALRDFDRVSIANAGNTQTVTFDVTESTLSLVNEDGAKELYSGTHYLIASDGNGQQQVITVQVQTKKEKKERKLRTKMDWILTPEI